MMESNEYKILSEENACKGFFEAMKENYDGEETWGPCRNNFGFINIMLYTIRGVEVRVSDKPFYRDRLSSVIIDEEIKVGRIKSEIENKTGCKLVIVEHGNKRSR